MHSASYFFGYTPMRITVNLVLIIDTTMNMGVNLVQIIDTTMNMMVN